jgi:hypothetical protein
MAHGGEIVRGCGAPVSHMYCTRVQAFYIFNKISAKKKGGRMAMSEMENGTCKEPCSEVDIPRLQLAM